MTWNAERMTLELNTPAPRSLLGGSAGPRCRSRSSRRRSISTPTWRSTSPSRCAPPARWCSRSRAPQRLARWVGPLFPSDPAPLADVGATNLRVTISTSNELAVAGDVQFRTRSSSSRSKA
jgi:hypothetical protein